MSAVMVAVSPRTTSRALPTVLSGCASVPGFVSPPFGATNRLPEVIAPPLFPLQWHHIDGFHEQSLPLAPTTMRPLTAMGEVQRWTPLHEPVPPSNTLSPVSPSTPLSCPLFANQTIGFDLPSVVVEIGADGGFGPGVHQATFAVGGEPPVIFTLMTARPVTLFGQSGALSTVNARYVPFAVVYAVGEVFTPANAGMEGFAT